MRPGGAGARPPAGPLPTDRDSLISIGASLVTMLAAIAFGLVLSGMLPEAAAVIETPTPQPSLSVVPSPSAPAASATPEPSPTPRPLLGTVTFGYGLNQSTQEVIDLTDTFTRGQNFCHSIELRQRFKVTVLFEEILKIGEDGTPQVVQRRREGQVGPIDPNGRRAGFCAPADWLIDGVGGTEGWGVGEFILREYRVRNEPQLLAEARFTLTE
jgi:hypothetical protein